MKNRARLVCLLFFAGTLVLASFFGGNFAYGLIWLGVAVPLVCLLHVIFTYANLKVYQYIDRKIAVKGERLGYEYILSNESFFQFSSVCVKFMDDCSAIDAPETGTVTLSPGENIRVKTTLTCLYRGEYPVGIDEVRVSDFLGLFTLTRKRPCLFNQRVYPRRVRLETASALKTEDDLKRQSMAIFPRPELPDIDLREFQRGDSVRMIGWKASARAGTLMVRRYDERPKTHVAIVLDLSPPGSGDTEASLKDLVQYAPRVAGAVRRQRNPSTNSKTPKLSSDLELVEYEMEALALSDMMIEATLAAVDYYHREGVRAELHWHSSAPEAFSLSEPGDAARVYDASCTVPFTSRVGLGAFLGGISGRLSGATMLLVVCAGLDIAAIRALNTLGGAGLGTTVLLVGEHASPEPLTKARVIPVPLHRSIREVLE